MALYPAIFIGHGSPMNGIENNEFSLKWHQLGSSLPKPAGVICISAHWVTQGTFVTAMDEPRTIHDFYGFPEELNQVQYPAPGIPVLAREICTMTQDKIKPDYNWGMDHGSWTVLKRMFPDADIPVIQISLNSTLSTNEHFLLAQELKSLRERNYLILGSGNIVHNLRMISWSDNAYPWALQFDEQVKTKIINRNFSTLFQYKDMGEIARLSIPTDEHFIPLLYILAMTNSTSNISFFCEKITMGAISMRSFVVEN